MREKYEPKHLSPKKKHEWSQMFAAVIAASFGFYGMWCGWQYYCLCKYAIESGAMVLPDVTLAVTSVTVVLGSLLSYLLYQWGLKNSLNKHQLTIDAAGAIKKITSGNINDVIEEVEKVAAQVTEADDEIVG